VAALAMKRAVLAVSTWPARDPPHGSRGGPTGRPIRNAAEGHNCGADGPTVRCPIAAMQRTAVSQADAFFIYIRQTARPSASLLLFPLPWQERLGVAFG
jgi:hypothetical protein